MKQIRTALKSNLPQVRVLIKRRRKLPDTIIAEIFRTKSIDFIQDCFSDSNAHRYPWILYERFDFDEHTKEILDSLIARFANKNQFKNAMDELRFFHRYDAKWARFESHYKTYPERCIKAFIQSKNKIEQNDIDLHLRHKILNYVF